MVRQRQFFHGFIVAVTITLVATLLAKASSNCVSAFVIHNSVLSVDSSGPRRQCRMQKQQQRQHRQFMVRNIDLPEALILFGRTVLEDPVVADTVRQGLPGLLQECHDCNTEVMLILDNDEGGTPSTTRTTTTDYTKAATPKPLPIITDDSFSNCHHLHQSHNPVQDLLDCLDCVTIQPRPFGGSSGFSQYQNADPERPPHPQHCVVLCESLAQTRAARAVGMRVISVDFDDPLADAVLFEDEIDFGLDDIATPGSFWLNPPHPRDDDGNRVDPYDLVMVQGDTGMDGKEELDAAEKDESDDMDDDELNAILADMTPL